MPNCHSTRSLKEPIHLRRNILPLLKKHNLDKDATLSSKMNLDGLLSRFIVLENITSLPCLVFFFLTELGRSSFALSCLVPLNSATPRRCGGAAEVAPKHPTTPQSTSRAQALQRRRTSLEGGAKRHTDGHSASGHTAAGFRYPRPRVSSI